MSSGATPAGEVKVPPPPSGFLVSARNHPGSKGAWTVGLGTQGSLLRWGGQSGHSQVGGQ